MYVGLLTAPFADRPLAEVVKFAAENGFRGIELSGGPGHPHFDTDNRESWKKIGKLLRDHGVGLSAVAMYADMTADDPEERAENVKALRNACDAANELEVGVVCTLAGLPPAGKTRMATIEEDCAEVFPPILEHAEKRFVSIALENWYETNIQGLHHWYELFERVPNDNFGLNFDPSHLLWMDIDYINALGLFEHRIFHTHAKDTEINEAKRRFVGNQSREWWRYVIPGLGRVQWGEYIAALRSIGYDGALSIEHEDDTVEREPGFLLGKRYLEQFIP